MVDFNELMQIFSIPRPNGSREEQQTREAIEDWLTRYDIAYRTHSFRLYPHFFLTIGLWLIISRSLLAAAVWMRWGWPTLIIALIGLLGGLVDVALRYPLITWPGALQGKNILIEFEPLKAVREIVLSAHYDTKTELLDHKQRLFFVKNLRLGIFLTIMLGLIGPLDRALWASGSNWAAITYSIGVLASLVLLFLAWGLGLNLSMGRFRSPSQGAVDNGSACAILLGLAERVNQSELPLERTRLTLALFTGEEVNMQGSNAYIGGRQWSLPAMALNLEVMAQNGDYVFWEQDGTSLKLVPTSNEINRVIAETVNEVTGSSAKGVGPVNSDGYAFLRAGIPATTLGTYDTKWVDRGFHSPSDNLDRVVMRRIPEGIEILTRFIGKYEEGEEDIPTFNRTDVSLWESAWWQATPREPLI